MKEKTKDKRRISPEEIQKIKREPLINSKKCYREVKSHQMKIIAGAKGHFSFGTLSKLQEGLRNIREKMEYKLVKRREFKQETKGKNEDEENGKRIRQYFRKNFKFEYVERNQRNKSHFD